MDKYEKIVELARRRGFFWPSVEIYGGVRGFIDLGPLGALLKKNIEEKWRRFFVLDHQEFMVEIVTPVIMPAKVFEASGHVEHFTDYIVECKVCGRKYRADHLIEEAIEATGLERLSAGELTELIRKENIRCPECGGELGEVRKFNLLFRTTIGPYSENVGYARPEAAQGMFTAFKRVYECTRRRLPLGIAQIGRVMRNEISPRQGPIRLREFTIMELELFFDPENPKCELLDRVADEELRILTEEDVAEGRKEPRVVTVKEAVNRKLIICEWLAYFMAIGKRFVESLGIPEDKQVFIAKLPEERAHYSAQTFDQLVLLDRWGWVEVAGHSYRTGYDLSRHMQYSGEDLRVFQEYEKPVIKRYVEVRPLMRIIGPKFKEKAKEIAEELAKIPGELILKELKEKGYLEVKGERITEDMLEVKVKEVKETGRRFIPHVAEPSYGLERLIYATLEYAYTEKDDRVVLKLPPDVAPIKVVVLPLILREGIPEKAREVYELIKRLGITVMYDDSGSIGRRYARADEIGVPIAVTIDGQTLKDDSVTLRDRDTWAQVRVPIADLPDILIKYMHGLIRFEDLIKKYGRYKAQVEEERR